MRGLSKNRSARPLESWAPDPPDNGTKLCNIYNELWNISKHAQEQNLELLQKLAKDLLNASVGGRSDEQKRAAGRLTSSALELDVNDLCATSPGLANARR